MRVERSPMCSQKSFTRESQRIRREKLWRGWRIIETLSNFSILWKGRTIRVELFCLVFTSKTLSFHPPSSVFTVTTLDWNCVSPRRKSWSWNRMAQKDTTDRPYHMISTFLPQISFRSRTKPFEECHSSTHSNRKTSWFWCEAPAKTTGERGKTFFDKQWSRRNGNAGKLPKNWVHDKRGK